MPNATNKTPKPSVPAWFNQKPNATERARFKDATVNYILDNKMRDAPPRPNINIYRAIIRCLLPFERKWSVVKQDNFNPSKYAAHQSFADTVRNLLNSEKELSMMLDEADPTPGGEEDNEEEAPQL